MKDNKRLVTIIIPTLDNAKYIDICVDSVLKQTYKNIEIIIVSGDSFNRLDTVLPRSEKIQKVISQKGRSVQKNYGAQLAEGEVLYFVDSDFLLDRRIVESCVKDIEEGYDMVEVHNTSDQTVSFWAKVRKFERDMLIGDEHNISPRFVTKKAFMTVGGFDETMIAGEDYDIYNKMRSQGFMHSYCPYYEVHLDEPKSIIDIVRKHYFYGQTMNRSQKKKVSNITFWQKSPIKLAYIKNIHKFPLNPILSLGLIFYNFVRYSSAIIGYLSRILSKNRVEDKNF